MAAAVEKTALHPIARAIVNEAESLKLTIPVTRAIDRTRFWNLG